LVESAKLRRVLERSILAAGYELGRLAVGDEPVDLLFVDHVSRQNTSEASLAEMTVAGGSVVILGESLADDAVAQLLKSDGHNHLISEHVAPDEAELLITTVKLASGDIFGLEKYLPWGVKVHERTVSAYGDKSTALRDVVAFAKGMGGRSSLLTRMEQAVDELLMNALYDAPAARSGDSTAEQMEKLRDGSGESVTLRFGCDGRYLVVSASDNYGELRKNEIFDHLVRARTERAPKREGKGGAGLGLFIVLSSVTRFIANIDPGNRTEVVCVFDLHQSGRQQSTCAQSVHVFGAPAEAAA
jgi:signal transduction histidine kinase